MAKNTRYGGASMTPDEFDNAEYVSPRVTRPGVGPMPRATKGEKLFHGSNLDQSTNTRQSDEGTQSDGGQSPVQETDNRSFGNTESVTVNSADGSTQETEMESPSPSTPETPRKAPVKAAKKTTGKARVRSTDDDF